MLNLLNVLWLLCILSVWITYLLLVHQPQKVPDALVSAFLYGKLSTNNKKASFFERIAIPKRWFVHFYEYSVVLFGVWTLIFFLSAMTGTPSMPGLLQCSMDILIHDRSTTCRSPSPYLFNS
ncbi:putative polyprenol reductase-like [Tropilaelaps mercedesae]|uniref:Putative polyprenol reductase-like n=1 Tax=Tropilaelaps mercedesae TaxID=418985 RepID=A0A1V9XXR9_9ACAR|nr:putative polyprenol reductase-like [Tropilaelaps mercedesae]